MTVPPEKKRRLTDDWGDDDDFDQILTQHGNLEQIDNLVESSQQVLKSASKSFKNEIKCKEVVRTKNHFYQRHNSFGSPVTFHQKQKDSEIDDIEQQMFTKDGEIKNLKIRLAALQKDLYLQKVEASEEKKKLATKYEKEKESLNKEIEKLKTDNEFKDHELKKQKYASPCSQSITNKPFINFPSSPNNTDINLKNSLNKKPFKSSNQNGFQLSDTFSKVLSKNQESQTSSMGLESKNVLKPYKLSSRSSLNSFPMATIINLQNLHKSLVQTQLSPEQKEDLNNRSLMTLLESLNFNNINGLHNKNNFTKVYNDQLLVLTDSLKDKSDKVISNMSQSKHTLHPDFAQQPFIYSDFQNHFLEMVYGKNIENKEKKLPSCDIKQNHKMKTDRYSICDTQKAFTSSNFSKSSLKFDSSNISESSSSHESPVVSFSRDLNVLKNILIFFKELNIDLNSRCVESICSLIMRYPTCKESFYNTQVFLPIIDIITLLISFPLFHPHLRDLFKESLLLNILKSHNADNNYNDSNSSSGSDNICFFVDLERGVKECLWYRLAKLLESVSHKDELFDLLCSRKNEGCLISCLCNMCHHIRSNHPCVFSCMLDRVFLNITANILTRVTTSSLSSSSSSITPSTLRMQDCQCFYKLSKEIFSIIENNIDKFFEIRHKTYDFAPNEMKKYRLITDQISKDLADQTEVMSLQNLSTTPRLLFTNAVQAELLLQNFTALQSVSAHFKKEFTTSLLINIGVMQSFKTFLSTHSSFLTEHQYSELLDVVTCHLNHVNPDEIGLIDE